MVYTNILIIQPAFIGDAILASSLVEKLHHHLPAASISILVRKGNEPIYYKHPFLKQILIWDKQQNKLKNLFKLLFTIRKNKFDCVINCHRFASSGLLTGFSKAKFMAGYTQNPFSFLFNVAVKHTIGNGLHETDRYNQLVESFTNNISFKPKLYPISDDEKKIKPYTQTNYVCMAPASVWFTKQLPAHKWVELINTFSADTTIYLLGAASDVELCNTIKNNALKIEFKKNIEILAGKLSLLQACALMKKAQRTYVNDSAPLHLASAISAPVTAFFISTIPAFGFGPLSDDAKIIEVNNLPCKPCGLHGHKTCPQGHFKCGNLLVV